MMAKIRMKTLDAGPNGIRVPGQIVAVDRDEAKTLIAGGYAEAVDETTEQADATEAEADQELEDSDEDEKPKRKRK